MYLLTQVIFTFIVPIAGLMSDKGLRRVNTTIVICIVAAATHVPMFLAFRTKSLAACWLLQIVLLSMVAWTMGILPAICSSIYPAGVRISGFNLGKWIPLMYVMPDDTVVQNSIMLLHAP
jgi:hypothetical protein